MITFTQKGEFTKTNGFLERALECIHLGGLDKYGRRGVEALSAATPKDTGRAATSWSYSIDRYSDHTSITWSNSDIEGGCNVAVLLQYGHATRNGGWVEGFDYINPALKPIFDEIAEEAWREVTR